MPRLAPLVALTLACGPTPVADEPATTTVITSTTTTIPTSTTAARPSRPATKTWASVALAIEHSSPPPPMP